MFDNHNSNTGQRPTRCKFGLKFTPKPANPELSVQENIMNFINDYRQWEKENQQPDYSHLSPPMGKRKSATGLFSSVYQRGGKADS